MSDLRNDSSNIIVPNFEGEHYCVLHDYSSQNYFSRGISSPQSKAKILPENMPKTTPVCPLALKRQELGSGRLILTPRRLILYYKIRRPLFFVNQGLRPAHGCSKQAFNLATPFYTVQCLYHGHCLCSKGKQGVDLLPRTLGQTIYK